MTARGSALCDLGLMGLLLVLLSNFMEVLGLAQMKEFETIFKIIAISSLMIKPNILKHLSLDH